MIIEAPGGWAFSPFCIFFVPWFIILFFALYFFLCFVFATIDCLLILLLKFCLLFLQIKPMSDDENYEIDDVKPEDEPKFRT